ncbi:hypothetical protein D1110_05615 [Actinobacillus pleuropneumoniae]|nr:hypothetical protein D1111_05315 [Actinobacillus pleuropneumoniae]UKH18604.1 hypothetical protein D1110_05615 [Actinobacillus pleuropneumoniae]
MQLVTTEYTGFTKIILVKSVLFKKDLQIFKKIRPLIYCILCKRLLIRSDFGKILPLKFYSIYLRFSFYVFVSI